MKSRIECVLGSDLLPWERHYLEAFLHALETRLPVRVHSSTLASDIDREAVLWVAARDAHLALENLPRHRGPVWVSVLAVQPRRRWFGIVPRPWSPRRDLDVRLLAHSPFAFRFHRELEGMAASRITSLPLPGLMQPSVEVAGTLRVGFATALNSDANLNFLVAVAHYVAQADPSVRFCVPQEGPLAAHLQVMLRDLKIENRFEALGTGDNVNALLFAPLKADQFLPVLWAASRGIPVLATDVPGIEQLLSDGHDGFVVPVNEAKPMGELLVRLSQDAHLRQALGERLRQGAAKRFALDRALDSLQELWSPGTKTLRRVAA